MSIESLTQYASSERKALNKKENRHIVALWLTVVAVFSWMLVFGREDLKADEPYMPLVQKSFVGGWSVFPAIEGHSLEQIDTLRQAYAISGNDEDFLYMLKGENGQVTMDRKSDVPGEPSYGFCQIHAGYHPEIVNDPRFFTDKKWQLEQCYKLWKGGVKFYGFANKWKVKKFFTFAPKNT